MLKKWRFMSELSLREAAEEMGISTPTLSRIERGDSMDGTTLVKILHWLLDDRSATDET